MADVKIAQLLAATTVSDTDLFLVEDSSDTKKIPKSDLVNSLGINLGGIVESGSNANGGWVKWADGTMIQWGESTFNTPSSGNSMTDREIVFPVNFINEYYSINLTQTQPHGNLSYSILAFGARGLGRQKGYFQYNLIAILGNWSGSVPVTVSWEATGKWK